MLRGVARFSYRHKALMLLLWIALLAGTLYLSETQGGTLNNNLQLPGSETQETFDLLQEKMPARAGDSGQIVFRAEDGVEAVRQRMEAGFAAAERAAGEYLVSLNSPYTPQGAATQVARSGAAAGKIAYAEMQFDRSAFELPVELSEEIQEAVTEAVEADGDLTVEFGGPPFQELAPKPGINEAIGLIAAVLILLVAFGSLYAMALPIVTALFGVGIGVLALNLLANYMDVVTFAPLVSMMIGLGVGIDYALFIVTRYRQNLKDGDEPEEAVVGAMTTAGRAVLFAGITVIISLLGMFMMDLEFINGLAVGAGIAVFVTMLASITLLPALMGMVGRRIDKLSIHFLSRRHPEKPANRRFWYRWSRGIQRHPLIAAFLCLLALGAIAAPALSIRLGNQDAGNGPRELTSRKAYDLLAEAFGAGYNGPLLVVSSFDDPEAALPRLQALSTQLAADEAVAGVSPVIPNDPANPSAALIQVIGRYAPQDAETDEMVHRLRNEVIAPARGDGLEIHSGGLAAIGVDLTDKMTERLPYFFGGVILLSFLLLMAAFRSILVPFKAAIMNVLAIAGAFGVLVAVFQWGWFPAEQIGVDRSGPIPHFSPTLLFAILFGLSMDYEVFLLSRIKEEYDKSKDNAQAVADGLASTARVITAAAAIMITVFFSFVLGENPNAKLVGLGLAAAVLIDATLVRMVLVPATMELLGDANWYL
ncbi:MAG TPA: MMPL family transporter, partial [Actinomycetota bacterium]|nr:MMPL family transporter [Actinomycetota bacterium]